MTEGRSLGEPSYHEVRERVRRWVKWVWEPMRRANRQKKDLAEALNLSKTTVGNIINNKEFPGLECFSKLHFRLRLDPWRMLNEDPEPMGAGEPPPIPPPPHTTSHPTKRAGRK